MAGAPRRGLGAPDGRLPIVIGVSGHRHLRAADLPKHREWVRELFVQLRRRYPSTPLRILTALAEGADRLVAEVTLEEGHEVVVPLPLEPADDERDFPHSAAQFHALLQRVPPAQVFVLPPDPADAEGLTPEEQREKRYLLLALWDGETTASTAGTSAVVRMKLDGPSGVPEAGLRPLDAEDGGPVYPIHAPRTGATEPSPAHPKWLFPQEGDAALFHTLCRRMERFNGEPLRRSIASHLPQATAALLLWQSRRAVQGRYLDYRALAEGLRVQFYWRLAGLTDSAASSYLRKQLDELRWIREALRAAAALPAPRTANPQRALKHGVGGQASYYADRARSQRQRLHLFERGSQLYQGRRPPRHRAPRRVLGSPRGPAPLAALARGAHGLRADRRGALGDLGRAARARARPHRAPARARPRGPHGERGLGAAAARAADRAA